MRGGGYDGGMSEVSTKVSEAGGHAPGGLLYMPAGEHVISATFNGKAATKRVLVDEAACGRLQADLERVWEAVEAGMRARPVVYFNHTAGPAAMVPRRFSWVPGKGIVLEGEWTAAGKEAVEGGSYAYFSPCFRRDRESGRVMGLTSGVEVGSLVNDPAFERNECIAAGRTVPEDEDVSCANFAGCNQHGHGFAGECEAGGNGGQSTFAFFGETKDGKRDRLKRAADKAAKVYRERLEADDKLEADGKWRDVNVDERNGLLHEARKARRKAREAGLNFDDDEELDGWDDWNDRMEEQKRKGKQDDAKAGAVYPPRGDVAHAGNCGDNADTAGGGGIKTMDENKLKTLLGLPADADSAAIEAALQKAAGAGKKLEAVEAELATMKKKEHEHNEKAAGAFADGLVKKGVIAPQDKEKVAAAKNLYMQSPADAEVVFGALPEKKEEAAVAGKVHPETDGAARADMSVMDHLMAEFKA